MFTNSLFRLKGGGVLQLYAVAFVKPTNDPDFWRVGTSTTEGFITDAEEGLAIAAELIKANEATCSAISATCPDNSMKRYPEDGV